MSSTAPVQDVAEVLIRSTVNDKDVEICLWFHCHLGAITSTRLNTICNRVSLAWNINFSNALAGPHLFREVVAIDRSSGSSLVSTSSPNVTKGSRGSPTSNNIALRFINLTDRTLPIRYGSNFVLPISEDDITDGVIDSSYASLLLGLWATNNQSHGPFGWHHIAVSLYQHNAPRAEGVWERVTHYQLGPLNPGAQRRRLTGR